MTEEQTRTNLTMAERGRWLVTTTTATLKVDFGTGTVQIGDENGRWHPLGGRRSLRLKSVDIRVGEPARWWMYRPGDGIHGREHPFVSEPVVAIVRVANKEDAAAAAGLSYLGPCYTEETMRERLGVEPAELDAMVADLQVLRVSTADGRQVFPTFQLLAGGTVLPGLQEVLSELAAGADDRGWTAWLWLTARPDYAGDRAVWELLRDAEVDVVVRAASRSAWAWRP
jgi:hypothetical protein